MTGVRLTPPRVQVCGHLSSSTVIAATCTATNPSSAAGTGIGARSTTSTSGPPWRWARSAVISVEPSSSHSTLDGCSQRAESDIYAPPVVPHEPCGCQGTRYWVIKPSLCQSLQELLDTAVPTAISGSFDKD